MHRKFFIVILTILIGAANIAAQDYVLPVFKQNRWGAINSKFEIIMPYQYRLLYLAQSGNIVFSNDSGKYGLADYTGKIIYKCIYETINAAHHQFAILENKMGFKLFDYNNRSIISKYFDLIEIINDSGIVLMNNNKYQIFNPIKKTYSQKYDSILYIFKDHYKAYLAGKVYLYNSFDNYTSDAFNDITAYENFFYCQANDDNYYYDVKMHKFYKTESRDIKAFGKYYAIKQKDKYLFLDKTTHKSTFLNITVLGKLNSQNNNFRGSMANFISQDQMYAVVIGKKGYGVISENLKILVPLKYSKILETKNGFKVFDLLAGGKVGWYDFEGNRVFDAIYDSYNVDGDYCFVRLNGRKGLCVRKKLTIPPKYYKLIDIGGGYLSYSNNLKYGAVTSSGREVLDAEYDDVKFANGLFIVRNKDKEGVMKPQNINVLPIRFDDVTILSSDYIKTKLDNKTGLYNSSGKNIIPHEYKDIYLTDSPNLFFVKGFTDYRMSNDDFNESYDLNLPEDYIRKIIQKYGLINKYGDLLLDTLHYRVLINANFSTGLIKVKKRNEVAILTIDKNGKLIEKIEYKNYIFVREAPKYVKKYHWRLKVRLWGLYSSIGNKIIEHKFSGINQNYRGVDSLTLTINGNSYKNLYGIVDNKNGRELLDAIHYDISLTDLNNGASFIRCLNFYNRFNVLSNEYKLIYKNLGYIDLPKNGFLRFNRGGKIVDDEDEIINDYLLNIDYKGNGLVSKHLKKKVICKSGRWGVMNAQGEIVVKPIYQYIQKYFKNVFIAKRKNKWGVIAPTGETIIDFQYDEIRHFSLDEFFNWADIPYYKVRLKNSWGVIDSVGNIIIPIEYQNIKYKFNKGHYFITMSEADNLYYGFVDTMFNQITRPRFSDVLKYKNNYAPVCFKRKQWNFIDNHGELINKQKYRKVKHFNHSLAPVQTRKGWYFINTEGNLMFDSTRYRDAYSFSEGLALVKFKQNEKSFKFLTRKMRFGYIDTLGNLAIYNKYKNASSFINQRAIVRLRTKYGVINQKGKFVIKPRYKRIIYDNETGYFILRNRKYKYALVDKNGKKIVKFGKYKFIDNFSDGLALVKKNRRYGYINSSGQIQIEPQYVYARRYSDGLAPVKNRIYWLYINKNGKSVINYHFKDVQPFKNGIAKVKDKNRNIYNIDINGNKTDIVQQFSKNLYIKSFDHRFEINRTANKTVYRPIANEFKAYSEGKIAFAVKSICGLYDATGKEILPTQYLNIEKISDGIFKIVTINQILYVTESSISP